MFWLNMDVLDEIWSTGEESSIWINEEYYWWF